MKMKMTHRHIAVGFLLAMLGGMGLGYYFGYDSGWEAAIKAIETQIEQGSTS